MSLDTDIEKSIIGIDYQLKNGGRPPNKQMGLDNRQEGNFITILQGKFCQRVPAGTVGSKERINKVGKTVHEKFYDSFTGKLIGIKTQDGEYGKSWIFSFRDAGEVYHLQLSYSNSFATAFLKILPNVDLTKEIKVMPSTKLGDDGKNKSSLFINQDGVALKHAYTRENPNGMPDMEQVTVKGQQVWDDTKRLEFLHNMVATKIIPQLEGVPEASAPAKLIVDEQFDAIGQGDAPIDPATEDVPF